MRQGRITKAVIPAAGLGTRFLPATKAQPKEMLPVLDKPVIQFVVEEAAASGIQELLIVTGRGKRAIEDHFDFILELEEILARRGRLDLVDELRQIGTLCRIYYVRQKEPLGLGDAVRHARGFVGEEPFALLLGDEFYTGPVPCLRQLIEAAGDWRGCVVAVAPVAEDEVERYGVVRPAGEPGGPGTIWPVADLVEKPRRADAPSCLAVIGRYVLTPEVFAALEDVGPGAGGEVQLTDALRILAARGLVVAFQPEATRHDVGDRLGYLKAVVEEGLARPELSDDFARFLAKRLASLHPSLSGR